MSSWGSGPGGKAGAALAGAALAAGALAAVLGAAGCGSSGSSAPSWATALGSGVTIVPPGSPAPGNESPGGVIVGVIGAVSSAHYTDLCKYEQPSQQSTCNAQVSQVTPAIAKSQLPTIRDVRLGYVAIDGARALVGTTGTFCVPHQTPSCYTNSDPAAIFDSGRSFDALWSQAQSAASNVYSLSPVIEVNGSWYAYGGSS